MLTSVLEYLLYAELRNLSMQGGIVIVPHLLWSGTLFFGDLTQMITLLVASSTTMIIIIMIIMLYLYNRSIEDLLHTECRAMCFNTLSSAITYPPTNAAIHLMF
jgi:hypothetical protein